MTKRYDKVVVDENKAWKARESLRVFAVRRLKQEALKHLEAANRSYHDEEQADAHYQSAEGLLEAAHTLLEITRKEREEHEGSKES